jgi:hypothetical protein
MNKHAARLLASVFLPLVMAGCASIYQRRAVFADLSGTPIAAAHWRKIAGVYSGPLRSTSSRFGNTGVVTENVRLELYGTPGAPLVFLKVHTSYTSANIAYGERMESFTNIPSREFGVKGRLAASSHAPNQLYISLRPQLLSPHRGTAMIVTFHENGGADIDLVGHFQRRGIGTLHREPLSETGR